MSRLPAPEILPEVVANSLVTTYTKDRDDKDLVVLGTRADETVAIAPVKRDEPVVTRKVRRYSPGL